MASSSPRRRSSRSRSGANMVFSQRNYVFLLAAVAAIVVGFAMMRIENEVNGFISLYVSPLIILAGYLGIIYAILWRPGKEE